MSEHAPTNRAAAAKGSGEQNTTVAEPRMTYEVLEHIPPDPTVRIIFHGLLSFFFDRTRQCQVGIPNTTQGLGQEHRHPHEFEVSVWTKVAGQCPPSPLTFPIKNSKLIERVDIQVTNPTELNGVYVYENRPHDPFNRVDTDDPRDWRWVLDFESNLFYPEGIDHIPPTLNPSVFINNGLFYTFHKTASKFRLHPSDGSADKEIGSLSEIQACNIYLGPGSLLTLTISPLPTPIILLGGIGLTYQIDITNNCRKGGKQCKFEPNGGTKEERNDFYLYYETFNRPANKPEFELQLTERVNDDPRLDNCAEKTGSKNIESSKDSPCGGSGYGQTSGV